MRLIDADALDEKLDVLMVRFAALGRRKVAEDYNFVRTVLLTAPTIEVPRWIPVTERLPEKEGRYLVIMKSGTQSVQWFYKLDHFAFDTYEDTTRYFGNVALHHRITHWMPLPDAPKDGDA
jgi:hypothetical protein